MTVTFAHESGAPVYNVPGYFAADGNAATTSATAGNKWRAHFSPDKTGRWDWRVAFVSGKGTAVDAAAAAGAQPVAPFDGTRGSIQIAAVEQERAATSARWAGWSTSAGTISGSPAPASTS